MPFSCRRFSQSVTHACCCFNSPSNPVRPFFTSSKALHSVSEEPSPSLLSNHLSHISHQNAGQSQQQHQPLADHIYTTPHHTALHYLASPRLGVRWCSRGNSGSGRSLLPHELFFHFCCVLCSRSSEHHHHHGILRLRSSSASSGSCSLCQSSGWLFTVSPIPTAGTSRWPSP